MKIIHVSIQSSFVGSQTPFVGQGDTLIDAVKSCLVGRSIERNMGSYTVKEVLEVYHPKQKNIVNHSQSLVAIAKTPSDKLEEIYVKVRPDSWETVKQLDPVIGSLLSY